MVTATTTTAALPISGGAVAGIIIGGLVLVGLLVWLTKLVTLYLFETIDPALRPATVADGTDNTCCDMGCNACNMAILRACCPGQIQNVDLYAKDRQQYINIAGQSTGML